MTRARQLHRSQPDRARGVPIQKHEQWLGVSGQTSHENVAGGPSFRIGGPDAQASSRTRERWPAPPGSTTATPRADGSPPATVTVSRCGLSGWETRRPTTDQASPESSAGPRSAASDTLRVIQAPQALVIAFLPAGIDEHVRRQGPDGSARLETGRTARGREPRTANSTQVERVDLGLAARAIRGSR